MNIKDSKKLKIPKDKLDGIFYYQTQLLRRYSKIEGLPKLPLDIDSRNDQKIIKEHFWRIVEELGEAANCLKNKPWKQTHMSTDKDHFEEEIADAFHFFIEMLICIGWSPRKLFELYTKKMQVNKFRIRSKY